MLTTELHPDQWLRIIQFLRTCSGVSVGQEENCRRFLTGILWISRTGAQWRALPPEYGRWNSVYKRFLRWCEQGVWKKIQEAFANDPDLEHLLLDSTVIQAHPCAAGAPFKSRGQGTQGLGRSRGGFSSKIHMSVVALGSPL